MKNGPNDHFLGEKIPKLFQLRLIPEMVQMAGISTPTQFLKKLTRLQHAIYQLDLYLEQHWEISTGDLESYWSGILDALAPFGIPVSSRREFCAQIMKYQFLELDMREQKWPSDKSFDTVYTDKSCDIKLIRTLIYREKPDFEEVIFESDWHWYDLITEVYDDLRDVYEDKKSYNGNCYMISLIRHGLPQTHRNFNVFIKSIDRHATATYSPRMDQKPMKRLALQTSRLIRKSQKLLELRKDQKGIRQLGSSALAGKM